MTSPDAAPRDGSRPPLRVLFVCTHNSARSIMAEALLRAKGGDAFEVFSAGTEVAEVRPLTLKVLREAGLPTEGLRSKSVQEFMGQKFDYVITVCDTARQNCPVFPGEGQRLPLGLPRSVAGRGQRGGTPGGLPPRLHGHRAASRPLHDRVGQASTQRRLSERHGTPAPGAEMHRPRPS